MAKDDISAVNLRTGEIYGLVAKSKRGGHPYGFAFHITGEEEYEAALRHLRGEECRVFCFLPIVMKRGNWVHATPSLISERVGIHYVTASRIMAKLVRQRIVGEIDGGRQFNPRIAWKGSTPELRKAIVRWDAESRRLAEKARLKLRAVE